MCQHTFHLKQWLPSGMLSLNYSVSTVHARFGIRQLLFVPELKEYLRGHKLSDDENVMCTACGWLEQQEEVFLYNGVYTLKKCWTNDTM